LTSGRRIPLAAGARAFLRFSIGLLLFATAVGKLADPAGFASVLDTYRVLPSWALLPLALAIPLAELLLAGWLAIGRRLRAAAIGSAVLHAAYGAWAGITLARGLQLPNCGCFGVFLPRPLTWGTVLEDGILVTASLALAALTRPST
jgi:Methylamine utilisation protein MauE